MDAFASESNARAAWFWSWFHEPGSESIDALCVLNWVRHVCLICCAAHREVLYAFPPTELVRITVGKAYADRAL